MNRHARNRAAGAALLIGLCGAMPLRPVGARANTQQASDDSPAAQAAAQPAVALVELAGKLRLAGEGVLTWFGLKIYRARLWVGAEGMDSTRPMAAPFALELTYARAFEGHKIAERSLHEIEKLGLGDNPHREAWLADMKRIFPDVAAGDRLTGVYRPGGGTTFLHNERAAGEIADPQFAAAFFAIWLDPRTAAPGVRKQLLARAAAVKAGERAAEK